MRFLRTVIAVAVVVAVAATTLLLDAGLSQGGPDEQAIRRVIETWVQAVNAADLPTLLAQFADDATIDSKVARARVNKRQYADAMATAFRTHALVGMAVSDVRVSLVNEAQATVLTTIYPMSNAARFVYLLEWKLEKRDARWVIVETAYRSRAPDPVVRFEVA